MRALALGLAFIAAPALAETPLPPTVEAFSAVVADWAGRHGVAANLAVTRHDRLVHAAGFGGRGAHGRVHLASLSKAITAACAATLVRQGRLTFDSRLGEVLAGFFRANGAPKDPRVKSVTVAQLLTHRAGYAANRGDGDPSIGPLLLDLLKRKSARDVAIPEMAKAMLRSPLKYEPGAGYHYSNAGYLMLGLVIETAAGEAYEPYCARSVLATAGIRDAGLSRNWRVMSSYGGWELTGPEYLAFLRQFEPGRESVLDRASRTWMLDPEGKWTDGKMVVWYGLGLLIRRAGRGHTWWHTGSWNWRQADARDGPLNESFGTLAVRAGALDAAWFVAHAPYQSEEKRRELDAALWRAAHAVKRWPASDGFKDAGVGR